MKLAEMPGSVKADKQGTPCKHQHIGGGSHVKSPDTQHENVSDNRVEKIPIER